MIRKVESRDRVYLPIPDLQSNEILLFKEL